MKIFFSVCLLTMLGLVGFSQNNDPNIDPRLFDVYSSDQIAKMQADQPQTLAYLNYYVQNGYFIMDDVPVIKMIGLIDISTIKNTRTGERISADEVEKVNLLLLSIKREQDEALIYKVSGANKVIVFRAPKEVINEFNQISKK